MKPLSISQRILFNRLPLLFFGLIAVLPLGLNGCAPSQEEELAGVSVPIPAGMKKIPNSSDKMDLGIDQKGAQASFQGELSEEDIRRFYFDVLPAADWQPDAKISEEVGGYAFKRGNQIIAIRILEGTGDNSTLIVSVKVGEFIPTHP